VDTPQRVVLDLDSTEIPIYGQQEHSPYNGAGGGGGVREIGGQCGHAVWGAREDTNASSRGLPGEGPDE